MTDLDDEDTVLRSVALQNANSILLARQRAEEELIRTREALRESQERLKVALSVAGTGTFRWDLQTNIVEWDGDLGRLFGFETDHAMHSVEELIAVVHPDDRGAVMAGCDRSAHDGSDFDMECRVVWPDGSIHWIDNKAKAFFGEDGKPLYMTGVCADITNRRAAAEALRESEERLRGMFNQAAVGIAVAQLDGRFVDMNRKVSDILGYSPDELRQMTILEITHPDDLFDTQSAVRGLLDGSTPECSLEQRYVRKDRTVVWSLSTVTLLTDAAGRAQRFITVLEDITPRKRMEAALREETRVLELLNETGRTLASTLELPALLHAVTEASIELSGAQFGAFFHRAAGNATSALVLSTLSGAPREVFEKFGASLVKRLFGPEFRVDTPIRCGDVLEDPRYRAMLLQHGMPKRRAPVRSYLAVPVRSRSGEAIGGLFLGHLQPEIFTERSERLIVGVAAQAGIAIDNARLYEAAQEAAEERKVLLDSERAARASAERLSDVKDEFLATLSHELRTPLNAILGWSQILKGGAQDQLDLMKGLETIERNARAQTQLIEDLLDMSRITSGKLRLDTQAVQPASFIEAAVETLKPAADAKGITLEKDLDPSTGRILGDPGRLQQIIWNLLSNGIKFTPKNGTVRIRVEQVDSRARISVEDTGVGIRPEFIPHLFERFRQGDASTTRKYGGLGLGLSIVKSLVELHGGTVSVESQGEGQGTTVIVHLPLAATDLQTETADTTHRELLEAGATMVDAGELAGIKVLVVDDQAEARDLIRRVLEDCAAAVMTAATAEEALRLVQGRRPDVLVSDIGMPDADGFELLERVRALGPRRGGKVPAIALTAFARSEDRTRALRAGFLVHVSKPVDPSELVATVASVVRRMRPRRGNKAAEVPGSGNDPGSLAP